MCNACVKAPRLVMFMLGLSLALVIIAVSIDIQAAFYETFDPVGHVKIQYKWVEHGNIQCVAVAPGQKGIPCAQVSPTDRLEYKLIWSPPPTKVARK